MRELPILFSTPMVRATLDDRKSQTRRTQGLEDINKDPSKWQLGVAKRTDGLFAFHSVYGYETIYVRPRFQVGYHLWVRETWLEDKLPGFEGRGVIHYKADDIPVITGSWNGKWRPSIFMFRWASRITLEVTKVRVERLQDITESDAIAEGISNNLKFPAANVIWGGSCDTSIDIYSDLWDSINGKSHPWSSNPWVWVYDFKVIKSESK